MDTDKQIIATYRQIEKMDDPDGIDRDGATEGEEAETTKAIPECADTNVVDCEEEAQDAPAHGAVPFIGHIFAKRRAVAAGFVLTLALALTVGGAIYAMVPGRTSADGSSDSSALSRPVGSRSSTLGDAESTASADTGSAAGASSANIPSSDSSSQSEAKGEDTAQASEDETVTKEAGTQKPSSSSGASLSSNKGGSSNHPASKPSTSNSSVSSNTNSSSTTKKHTHTWVPVTKVVHHDAQYKTVHHEAQYKTVHHDAVTQSVYVCNGCGATFSTESAMAAHAEETLMNGDTSHSWRIESRVVQQAYDEQVLVSAAYDEQVQTQAAYDETVTTGYRCSGCGATK